MREEVNGILYLFGLSDDDRKKYSTVSKKSEAHFVKQRNPMYERRSLICVEPVDSFRITSPALPASRTLQLSYDNEMIRYRTIVGLRDSNLSQTTNLSRTKSR